MSEDKSIWKSIGNVLLVVRYDSIEGVIQWRNALKSTGLNVHNCRILSIVENKKERMAMGDMSYVTFISEGDYGFLGQLKNEDAKKILSDRFDALIVVKDCTKKVLKSINKVNCKIDIGLNAGSDERTINLESDEVTPEHLLNFVKHTLEKIS